MMKEVKRFRTSLSNGGCCSISEDTQLCLWHLPGQYADLVKIFVPLGVLAAIKLFRVEYALLCTVGHPPGV
jgi:hypothetical protein